MYCGYSLEPPHRERMIIHSFINFCSIKKVESWKEGPIKHFRRNRSVVAQKVCSSFSSILYSKDTAVIHLFSFFLAWLLGKIVNSALD